jgi:hypothetical protein
MLFWYTQYLTFVGEDRPPDSPFFVKEDGRHAVYQELLDGFREGMCRVEGITLAMALKLGLHGLRVLGYNCWRAASGEDVAALQGGWGSMAHRSYGRDTLASLLAVPQRAAAYAAANALPPMPLDEAMAAPDMGSPSVPIPLVPPKALPAQPSRARTLGSSSAEPLARAPSPTSAAAVDYLCDVVVAHERSSSRKAPMRRPF